MEIHTDSPIPNDAPCRHDLPAHRSAPRRGIPTRLSRHEGGYAAQGPGFYVWDRCASEVIRIAEALQSGLFEGPTTARYLIIDPVGMQED